MAGVKKAKPDLTKKVHEVPHKPGVYLMRDRFNRVIYVGKARDLRKRVSSYFLPSKIAQADLKTRAMLEATWEFETHVVCSEAESLLLEGKLIKEYRPRYNVSFRDDKRFLLVKIDMAEEWPRFRLARFKKDDNARYFGPYAHAGALRQTLNLMRKKFGVLTFGRGAPTERELKSATYQVPMRLSEITGQQYRERVAQACEFRDGLPDKNCYRRYRVRTVQGQDDFASMAEVVRRRYSRVLLEARELNPDTAEFSQETAGEAIARQQSSVSIQVAAEINSHVGGSRYIRVPDLIIVDGGKGQLSAACRELQRLGLHDLPIIGLAKEHEEIYRPGRALPLRLPLDSGALRLLQRIRDEAHRFANAYHQLLLKKRVEESILDDCPGVSQNRKNLLLRRFGSVNRLRKASVADIAATEGICPKLPEEVHRFLQSH